MLYVLGSCFVQCFGVVMLCSWLLWLLPNTCLCNSAVNLYIINFLYFSAILGRIDQVNQVLELHRESTEYARYNALDKWTGQLQTLHQAVVNKTA